MGGWWYWALTAVFSSALTISHRSCAADEKWATMPGSVLNDLSQPGMGHASEVTSPAG